MNLFFVHPTPKTCAEMHHDKHVVKMILEYAQILSTAHRVLDGEIYTELSKNGRKIKRWKLPDDRDDTMYKATHVNHPSTVWGRKSVNNYNWLYCLFIECCKEYTYRYGKVHKTEKLLAQVLLIPPSNIPDGLPFTYPPQCMPDEYKSFDTIEAYRTFYIAEKLKQSKYTKRNYPEWVPKNLIPLEYRI
jgi:hypothetical protein